MESELILRAKRGDRKAFESLTRAYLPRIYRTAYAYLRNVEDASDVCQDTFLRAYRSFSRFDEKRPFYPWLYQILKNLCINRMRRRKHRVTSTDQVESFRSGYPGPESELLRKEEAETVRKALDNLPDMHREILILRTYDGASYAEISEMLSVPQGTVMSRLYNARLKLKKAIESMEGAVRHEL
jgi:RNA polymerase sigma-70 factor (ECF subfamily)